MSEILTDGFPTTITFTSSLLESAQILELVMKEQEVTPPGISGGGVNETTSMRNETWRTRHPKKLITLTPMSLTVKYDPELFEEMTAMVNDNQEITVNFPDGSTLVWWGWVDSFTPNAAVEGEQPTAVIVVEPSNMDAGNNNVEIPPVYNPAV